MSKEETVLMYRDEFLASQKPDKRENFIQKSIDKQYASIMSWRRRQRMADETPAEPKGNLSANSLIAAVRKVRKSVVDVQELSQRDSNRLRIEAEELIVTLANYDKIRAQKELENLERENARMQARMEELRRMANKD